MIRQDIKFDFDDILIVPKNQSSIDTRSIINVYDENEMLPLFTAPMDTVVGNKNMEIFKQNKIYPIIPRTYKLSFGPGTNDSWIDEWVALGLNDFEKLLNITNPYFDLDHVDTKYILIDIANGNMKKMHDLIVKSKNIYGDKLQLMVGNVANPETYKIVSELGADYVRIGVGNGGGCFVENTKVITKRGIINIQDVIIGDEVLTHTGEYKRVYNTISYETFEDLIQINDNISTLDHEYYVLNKKYLNIITDDNIEKYAEWIEANKLTDEYFLLENVVDD
jgi:hypothetical protein